MDNIRVNLQFHEEKGIIALAAERYEVGELVTCMVGGVGEKDCDNNATHCAAVDNYMVDCRSMARSYDQYVSMDLVDGEYPLHRLSSNDYRCGVLLSSSWEDGNPNVGVPQYQGSFAIPNPFSLNPHEFAEGAQTRSKNNVVYMVYPMYALRTILKGEELCWNYPWH